MECGEKVVLFATAGKPALKSRWAEQLAASMKVKISGPHVSVKFFKETSVAEYFLTLNKNKFISQSFFSAIPPAHCIGKITTSSIVVKDSNVNLDAVIFGDRYNRLIFT